jgi:hypothetical protein
MHGNCAALEGSYTNSQADDSQGKHRAVLVTRRTALLSLAFFIGLAMGIVVAERLYVEINRPDLPRKARFHSLHTCVHSMFNSTNKSRQP